MPIYEYECPVHGKFEKIERTYNSHMRPCPQCGHMAQKIISLSSWKMGWNFLRNKSEGSPPAPEDSGYHPEWDQAYQGPQVR